MRYSREDCIEALRKAAEEYGPDLTVTQYRESGFCPSDRTILNRFGTWNEAKEAAELDATRVGLTLDNKYGPAGYRTTPDGYCSWQFQEFGDWAAVKVHRLLAVSEFGFDAVTDKVVHHKNDIPWDNRPENLEPMGRAEHTAHHREQQEARRASTS